MTCGYGGANILTECSIAADRGEIVVVVGPNGAGKSTAMKAIFGMIKLSSGRVTLGEKDITNLAPNQRVLEGMAFVPQTNNVFTSLSVIENLEMGAFINGKLAEETLDQIFQLFPVLYSKRFQRAGELSGGQRQQVAVGRALMTRPKVLLLDEPTAGVSPIVMEELFSKIIEISTTGIAVLMVEQNAKPALNIANRGYVLVQGKNRYSDTGLALLKNESVRKAFLGG